MSLVWLSLVGAIWLQSISGTNSNFPAYSSELKSHLSLSQLQLNNPAFASDTGKLFGWVAGFAAMYFPLWLVLLFGSFLGLIGYGFQYLFLIGNISNLSYVQIFFLTILSGNSICWINTVSYIITIHNFPFDRLHAVGLSTSYSILSAKIYTEIIGAFFKKSSFEKAKAYLLLNSVLPLVVCVLSTLIVRNIDACASRKMEGFFFIMFFITIATGIYAVVTSFISILTGRISLIIVIGMAVLLLAPLLGPIVMKISEKFPNKCYLRMNKTKVSISNMDEGVSVENEEEGSKVEINGHVEVHEDDNKEIGVWEMVKRVEFWLYFFVYLFGATIGLVYMNNLGQIAESRGYSRTSHVVSLSSSFVFFGRLLPSLLFYILSRSKCKVSTPATTAVMMAPMSAAFFLLLHPSNVSLHISTSIIGLSTGAIAAIAVSLTTELFGTKNFSVNHNILVANIPIGSLLYGNMAAKIYKKARHGSPAPCLGTGCYRTSFIVWGSLCCIGCLLAMTLHVRTRKLYT